MHTFLSRVKATASIADQFLPGVDHCPKVSHPCRQGITLQAEGIAMS